MESRHSNQPLAHAVEESGYTCPQCGDAAVTTSTYHHTFTYGSGESAVELSAHLPARHCSTCDFMFLDDEAERLKHNAVCEHLGVLAPAEIKRIRESYGMTRADFAQVTGLGEATLGRWENGVIIQTLANDRYIRLLAQPWIMRYLKRLRTKGEAAPPALKGSVLPFRRLEVSAGVLRKQASFQLRLAS